MRQNARDTEDASKQVGNRGAVKIEKAVRQASETTEDNERVFGGGSIPWGHAGKRVMTNFTILEMDQLLVLYYMGAILNKHAVKMD
jgi:hypothetical protein